VGAPTLGLFLRMDMERWGHPFPPHRMVDLSPHAGKPDDLATRAAEEARSFAAGLAAAPQRELSSRSAGTPGTSTTTE
ncbi:MAG TPA: hypothetical protein VK447_07780, partial [Myxococcaceae bacterium]|nr:hypothetical protein [Myxococcaceae bacterium]